MGPFPLPSILLLGGTAPGPFPMDKLDGPSGMFVIPICAKLHLVIFRRPSQLCWGASNSLIVEEQGDEEGEKLAF